MDLQSLEECKDLNTGAETVLVLERRPFFKNLVPNFTQRLIRLLTIPFFSIFTDYQILGRENLVGIRRGPLLIVANHKSFLDPLLIGRCFPFFSWVYPVRFIGRDILFRDWYRRMFFKCLGAFPAYQGQGMDKSLEIPDGILRRSGTVAFFPEGYRILEDSLGKPKVGAAVLALRHPQVTVLPLAIAGTQKVGRFGLLRRRPSTRVNVGRPFRFSDEELRDVHDPEVAIEKIMGKVRSLYEEVASSRSNELKPLDVEGMEYHPLPIKILRLVTVPLLNAIPPKILQRVVRKSSPYGRTVIERPGTTHSLETMYTKHERKSPGVLSMVADFFWHNVISQPKAIRNRLKIVEKMLNDEIEKLAERGDEVRTLNLGGGSSRAIIHTISRLNPTTKISVITVDKDPRALALGQEIAKKLGVDNNFRWVEGNVKRLPELVPPNSANIIEMVGLLDYFDHEKSKKLIGQIYEVLMPGGLFITANVYPNSEMDFVSNVGWPKMYYKIEAGMLNILKTAGFSEEHIEIYCEPFKVHIICRARK